MNPGAPLPPAPPHDPRSLLLNGRTGFRAVTLAPGTASVVVDPECCALVLPLLPDAVRELAETSGSLGGVRPPANVASGPGGDIYLLDRTASQLKHFDPCLCTFTDVPCVGGSGGGARQLRHPGDITIACGNLYVADTGVESVAPVEACDDQLTADTDVQRENHRVSVFALKGFALRGHLVPPKTERPWRPVSVAVDSLARVWVGDVNGKLHRFSPSGAWEKSWPMVPVPRHLAVDCRDRVYVVAPGQVPTVRVLDSEARPVSDPPTRPDQIRSLFPRLPFHVDALGRLWLEPLCDPRCLRKTDPNATIVFDDRGQRLDIRLPAQPAIFEDHATYRSEPLDSGIAECIWHRVRLFGALPAGTRIHVRAFAAEQRLTASELDAVAVWHTCATADTFDDGRQWDCLIRSDPGRYLWLELVFEGGVATPVVGAIVVEFPRVSLRRFLPAVFGMEPVSADFTDRFLALFDTPLRTIERHVDLMARLFDPASAPAAAKDPRQQDFLSWLASWIGVTLDRNWDVATRRRFLKRAGALFDRRGTVGGLREQLLVLLGFDRHLPCETDPLPCGRCTAAPLNCGPEPKTVPYEVPPLVLEHFRLRRWLRLGHGRLGDEAVVWGERLIGRTRLGAHGQVGVTRLDTSPDPLRDPFLAYANQFSVFVPASCGDDPRARRALENLLRREAPAGTRGHLHFVEPRFRIGVQSMLGFDAIVAAVPQGVALGTTPLGQGSMLTSPPHMDGGPAIAVGKDGRIGTTTRLA